MDTKQHTLSLLKQMIGMDHTFREGQWEAIEAVAINRQRTLIVQRTGWGKSMVYFLATKLLREQGYGPTLLISPLLSLIRNQVYAAEGIGIRALTINSANHVDWEAIDQSLQCNDCDLLLISPERLNNDRFLSQTLPLLTKGTGLFVVDEAHCISDWGHDFRPDYRRIVRIINQLPAGTPVLGTTATANERVIDDIKTQFGIEMQVYRGPLERKSLRLQNIRLNDQCERLAWLAENLKVFKKSQGIVYCLTIPDTERVATWLRKNGYSAEAYHSRKDDPKERELLENKFLNNEIQILVATVALGMGFDKPDIGFIIHFQRPGSVIAYYQQVGRAGRALDKAYGILLSGEEDDDIQNYFIDNAFPEPEVFEKVIKILESSPGMSIADITRRVNISWGEAEKTLKLLELDGAVGQTYDKKNIYFRTPNPWQPDWHRMEQVNEARRAEMSQMQAYVNHADCLMEFLLKALDDPKAAPCGRCANCRGKGFSTSISPEKLQEAEIFLKGYPIEIEVRKDWPAYIFPDQPRRIPEEYRNSQGRSLSNYGDAGWGKYVPLGKYRDGVFSQILISASVDLIRNGWQPQPPPAWVCAIPSKRHPHLVPDLAAAIARELGLPFLPVLRRSQQAAEQKTMQNSVMQARNVIDSLEIVGEVPNGPVLLIDDIIDSGWTLTMAGYLLRKNGSGQVHPFTLAKATGKNT